MKQKLHYLFTVIILFNAQILFSQTTEDFEAETNGATTFSDNGQAFTITSLAGETTYDIEPFTSGGWNGSSVDNKFIDNSGNGGPLPATGNGSSFSISTTDGTDITIKSFYLFVSNYSITAAGTPTTLTFIGKKNGSTVYTIIKNSGIVDGSSFTPNNGFTFIDLSTEGGTDNSTTSVDEIVISSTNNADYLALDALTWNVGILSTNDFEINTSQINIIPNPSSDFILLSGLSRAESFRIYNVLGKEMSKGVISNNDKIDIRSLTNGIYFLKFENLKSIKFIKE